MAKWPDVLNSTMAFPIGLRAMSFAYRACSLGQR